MKIQDVLNQAKPCWKYAAMDQFKNCMSESSRYIEEEDAETKGVAEVFE